MVIAGPNGPHGRAQARLGARLSFKNGHFWPGTKRVLLLRQILHRGVFHNKMEAWPPFVFECLQQMSEPRQGVIKLRKKADPLPAPSTFDNIYMHGMPWRPINITHSCALRSILLLLLLHVRKLHGPKRCCLGEQEVC